MKECKKCFEIKPVEEYYNHPRTKDGKSSTCKQCYKAVELARYREKAKNPDWLEKERARGREKHRRLGASWKVDASKLNEARKRYRAGNKEKIAARWKSKGSVERGFERHHWSYLPEHHQDTILLRMEDHKTLHRFLIYDDTAKKFASLSGDVLETRAKHEQYIEMILQTASREE